MQTDLHDPKQRVIVSTSSVNNTGKYSMTGNMLYCKYRSPVSNGVKRQKHNNIKGQKEIYW